jgi:hypothetical protein
MRLRIVLSVSVMLALVLGGWAAWSMLSGTSDHLPLRVAETTSPSAEATQGGVTERAVPGMPMPARPVTPGAGLEGGAVKQLLPSAQGPSPEEEILKKLGPPPRPEALRPPASGELKAFCLQQAVCRAKLEGFQNGQGARTPLPPATSPSPEEQELNKLPPPAQAVPLPRRKSELSPALREGLFSWLGPRTAEATPAPPAFRVSLTPGKAIASPASSFELFCVVLYGNGMYNLNPFFPSPYASVENKPYATFMTSIPTPGLYLIDVAAGPMFAKMRHQFSGPIVGSWDFRSPGCSERVCHYVTVEYLAAGRQYFYFWPAEGSAYIYSVTIESYP